MATIASLNIVFRGVTGPLNSAVNSARKTMGGFQRSIFSLNGAIAGLGAGLSLNALKNSLEGTMESIDRVAKVSDRIGITTEALLGLQHAAGLAGVETAMLDQSLTKMGNFLAEAAIGGKSQTETLNQLGITARELSSIPLDQAFLKISDAIMGLGSPAERINAAMAIFGKSGAELIPLLQQDSAGIAETADEVDRLGASFSRVDAAQVEAANDALDRVGVVLEGVTNQLAIALAPAIEFVANKFIDWGTSGTTVGTIVLNAVETVAKGLGIVADVVDVVLDAFQFLQAGVTKAIAVIMDGLALFAKGLQEIVNLIPGADAKFGDFLQTIADDIHKAAADEWEEAKKSFAEAPPSTNIQKFFDDIRANSRSAAVAVSKAQKTLAEVKPPELLKTDDDKIAKLGKSVTDDFLTPLEEFQKRMEELELLAFTGNISEDTFKRAKNKALVDLEASLPDDNKRAGALEFGTSAAFSAQLDKPRKTEQQLLDESRMQTQIFREQLDLARKNGIVVYDPP